MQPKYKCVIHASNMVKNLFWRPATRRTPENVERVQAAISKDRRLTVRELEADLGIQKTTVSEILMQNLGIKCVMAKLVP